MIKIFKSYLLPIVLLIMMTSCQTHLPIVSEQSEACDNKELAVFQDVDYLFYANKLADELITSQFLKKNNSSRLSLSISPLVNKTSKALDIQLISQTIKNRILRSGKFLLEQDLQKAHYQLIAIIEDGEYSIDCKLFPQFKLQLIEIKNQIVVWQKIKVLKK
jgi:PBP1b-binding outer membrane lipoprotein LpoB